MESAVSYYECVDENDDTVMMSSVEVDVEGVMVLVSVDVTMSRIDLDKSTANCSSWVRLEPHEAREMATALVKAAEAIERTSPN